MTVLHQTIMYQPISMSKRVDNQGQAWWSETGQLSAFRTIEQARNRIAEEVRRYDVKVVTGGDVRFVIKQITTLTLTVEEFTGEDITVLMLTQEPKNVHSW